MCIYVYDMGYECFLVYAMSIFSSSTYSAMKGFLVKTNGLLFIVEQILHLRNGIPKI